MAEQPFEWGDGPTENDGRLPEVGLDDDTKEFHKPAPRAGVSSTLVAICLVLLLIGIGAFVVFHYMPLYERLAALEADVASLSDAQTRADAAETELGELRPEAEALRARLAELEVDHSTLSAQADALRAEREQAEAALAELRERMQSEIEAGDVSVTSEGGNLGIGLASRVLFRSGSADLSPRGQAILVRVAESLNRIESRVIQVAGHTDSSPISEALQERYPTNWELSTARATNVVRFLQDECEVPGGRLVAAGLAEHRPRATNRSARGRLLNRRIELTLLPMPQAPGED